MDFRGFSVHWQRPVALDGSFARRGSIFPGDESGMGLVGLADDVQYGTTRPNKDSSRGLRNSRCVCHPEEAHFATEGSLPRKWGSFRPSTVLRMTTSCRIWCIRPRDCILTQPQAHSRKNLHSPCNLL
jgi:hypothetical protein